MRTAPPTAPRRLVPAGHELSKPGRRLFVFVLTPPVRLDLMMPGFGSVPLAPAALAAGHPGQTKRPSCTTLTANPTGPRSRMLDLGKGELLRLSMEMTVGFALRLQIAAPLTQSYNSSGVSLALRSAIEPSSNLLPTCD